MRIYLDQCSLNRPFDDQSIDRNRLEAEAVLTILRHMHQGEWKMIGSTALDLEFDAMPPLDRRPYVKGFMSLRSDFIPIQEPELERAEELVTMGFRRFDALHVACAETARSDILLTTDDDMIRLGRRYNRQLSVRIENPLAWIKDQFNHGHD